MTECQNLNIDRPPDFSRQVLVLAFYKKNRGGA
jgi:hypothetical protein